MLWVIFLFEAGVHRGPLRSALGRRALGAAQPLQAAMAAWAEGRLIASLLVDVQGEAGGGHMA
jgi:hypothetical protein